MTPMDLELLKQLPLVGLFLVVVFKLQKDNREYLDHRDKIHEASSKILADGMRMMSDRLYGLGLAFVALAGEGDNKAGAGAAKKIMEEMNSKGYGMGD